METTAIEDKARRVVTQFRLEGKEWLGWNGAYLYGADEEDARAPGALDSYATADDPVVMGWAAESLRQGYSYGDVVAAELPAPTRLALACWWRELSERERELTPAHPAGNEQADAEWERESEALRKDAEEILAGVDRTAALEALRTDAGAGMAARLALRRVGAQLPLRVDLLRTGPGWREQPCYLLEAEESGAEAGA